MNDFHNTMRYAPADWKELRAALDKLKVKDATHDDKKKFIGRVVALARSGGKW